MKPIKFAENKETWFVSISFAVIIPLYFFQYFNPNVIVNATDVLTQHYFWEYFWHKQLHDSPSFSAWLPHINGGTTIGGALNKLFRPADILFCYFFPPHLSIMLVTILHFWLMALGTYLFARLIGLSLLAAFLSAIFFTLSAQLVTLLNAGHLGKINTIAWTPLVFWAVERGLQRKRWIDFIIAGGLLSAQLYEGHIQISFYVCIAIGIYFIARTLPQFFRKDEKGKEIGKLYLKGTVMVLVFVLLSAFTLAQWLEFKGQSDRGAGTSYEFATSWSMPPKELATYVVPQMFGLSRQNYKDPGKIKVFYWGEMPFTQGANYLGLFPLILATIALIRCRNKYVGIFLGITVIFLILAMGKYTPVYYFFYKYLGFKFFRVPKMNLFVVAFSVSIVAGYGVQWLLADLKKGDRKFLRKFILCLLGGIAGLVILTLIATLNEGEFVRHFLRDLRGWGRSYNPSLVLKRYQYALEGMWWATGLLTVCVAILAYGLVKSRKKEIFFILLLSFFLIDISLLNFKFLSVVPMKDNVYFSKDTAVKYFETDKSLYRVLNAVNERSWKTTTYLVPNKYILFNMHSATGYEAVQVARYNDFLGRMNFQNNLMDLLNIKYLVIDKRAVKGKVGDQVGKYEIVVDRDIKVLRNKSVLPRVFPVHKAKVFRNKNQVLTWLQNPSVNPRETVLLEEEVRPLSSSPKPYTESKVQVISYENNEILVDANMADNGFVVMSEKFYPGWKAYIDDVESKIYRADYAFRAVYVPKGQHKVKMSYEPESNKVGLFITLATLLCVSFILIKHTLDVHRRKQPGTDDS